MVSDRKYTTYGKRRNHIGSSHRDWLAAVNSTPSYDYTSSGSAAVVATAPIDVDAVVAAHKLKRAALEKEVVVDVTVEPQWHDVQSKEAQAKRPATITMEPRARVLSSNSNDSAVSTSLDSASLSVSSSSKAVPVVTPKKASRARPSALNRKDSNKASLEDNKFAYAFFKDSKSSTTSSREKDNKGSSKISGGKSTATVSSARFAPSFAAASIRPPSGHSTDSSVSSRRPLAPTSTPNAKVKSKKAFALDDGAVKPKRPPKEMDPATPVIKVRANNSSIQETVEAKAKQRKWMPVVEIPVVRKRQTSPLVAVAHSTVQAKDDVRGKEREKDKKEEMIIDLSDDVLLETATLVDANANSIPRTPGKKERKSSTSDNRLQLQPPKKSVTFRPSTPSSATSSATTTSSLSTLTSLASTLYLDDRDNHDFQQLSTDISSSSAILPPSFVPLLQACSFTWGNEAKVYDFASFVEKFPLLASSSNSVAWSKLGEATYSEVFVATPSPNSRSTAGQDMNTDKEDDQQEEAEEIVVKVIPLHMPKSDPSLRTSSGSTGGNVDGEMPQTSLWQDVLREIKINAHLAEIAATGFVGMKGAYLVQGRYPTTLLTAWDHYLHTSSHNAVNCRPDVFSSEQVYALICLSHGGTDLENAKLRNWREASSVFSQVANGLREAEGAMEFEHRDLHWGNILVQPNPVESGGGVQATIIDFTLSRAKISSYTTDESDGADHILAGGLEDEEIFQGSGDYQFDCYRIMKALTKADWRSYRPITNVVWLHYLTRKLLHDKKLKKPNALTKNNQVPVKNSISRTSFPSSPALKANTRSRRTIVVSNPSVTHVALTADLQAEKEAYDMLVDAERILSAAICKALRNVGAEEMATSVPNGGGKAKRGKKIGKPEHEFETPVDIGSAGDFFTWLVCQ